MIKLGNFIGTISIRQKIGPKKPQPAQNQVTLPTPSILEIPQVDVGQAKKLDEKAKAVGESEDEIQLNKKFQQARALNPQSDFVAVQSGFLDKVGDVASIDDLNKEVFHFKTVWPFDFFQAELIIYHKRIVVRNGLFFFSSSIDTILIDSIAVYEIRDSLFCSSIYIAVSSGQTEITINWVKPADAKRSKAIIDALILEEKGKIRIDAATTFDKKTEILEKVGAVASFS